MRSWRSHRPTPVATTFRRGPCPPLAYALGAPPTELSRCAIAADTAGSTLAFTCMRSMLPHAATTAAARRGSARHSAAAQRKKLVVARQRVLGEGLRFYRRKRVDPGQASGFRGREVTWTVGTWTYGTWGSGYVDMWVKPAGLSWVEARGCIEERELTQDSEGGV